MRKNALLDVNQADTHLADGGQFGEQHLEDRWRQGLLQHLQQLLWLTAYGDCVGQVVHAPLIVSCRTKRSVNDAGGQGRWGPAHSGQIWSEKEVKEEDEQVTLSQQLLAVLDFLKEELLHCLSILQIRKLPEVKGKKRSDSARRISSWKHQLDCVGKVQRQTFK